jgi:hypothetical protein
MFESIESVIDGRVAYVSRSRYVFESIGEKGIQRGGESKRRTVMK